MPLGLGCRPQNTLPPAVASAEAKNPHCDLDYTFDMQSNTRFCILGIHNNFTLWNQDIGRNIVHAHVDDSWLGSRAGDLVVTPR